MAFGNAKVVALAGLDIVPLLAGVPLVHAYVAPIMADDALNVIWLDGDGQTVMAELTLTGVLAEGLNVIFRLPGPPVLIN